MKAVGTYVTREEAEAVRAEMMKRPATPYQDSTLQDCFRMFKESREYKGRSDKARELYDIAWKYLRPLWHFKIAALYAQDFQNILDKMADNGLSQSMLEKERTLISKLYRGCQPCICPESRRTQISGTRDFHGRTGDADPEPKEHAHRADGNCSSGLRSAYL